MYIVTEGALFASSHRRRQYNVDAVIGLLGCFYTFNVLYTQCKAILAFLEQALLEIGLGQTLVTVSSFFNDLTNA